ncbi:hypothetical protein HNR46_000994 [Haloferula luteola]|uniref:Uncharacterized protein n=1 Tax=Haloferula luteola TaxID=595692 RepID=A0A840V9Y3_9BACT|nr:hypothetical protein [Haloferula luteola]
MNAPYHHQLHNCLPVGMAAAWAWVSVISLVTKEKTDRLDNSFPLMGPGGPGEP